MILPASAGQLFSWHVVSKDSFWQHSTCCQTTVLLSLADGYHLPCFVRTHRENRQTYDALKPETVGLLRPSYSTANPPVITAQKERREEE